MAKKYFLVLLLALTFMGCSTSVPKVDARFDPSAGLSAGEGVLQGTYQHPIAMGRALDFSASRRPKLVFEGAGSPAPIEIRADGNGLFSFKAPAGKYRLSRIQVSPQSEIFEGPKDGYEFEIQAGKTVKAGSIFSSCDEWSEIPKMRDRFQDWISKRQYKAYKRYDAKAFSCLVFLQE